MICQPARARLATGRRRRLRRLRRMDPNAVYYLVFGGAAVVIGIIVDAFSEIPWWTVAMLGLVGAWAFTWLTALDDVRHPWRSLRILGASTRIPSAATRTRVKLYEMPLYTPPSDLPGSRWLSGGGVSYGGGLLAPARPSAEITWSNGDATMTTRTVTRPTSATRSSGLPPGIGHRLALIEDDPGMEEVTGDELVQRLRTVTVSIDGRALTGTVLDLSPWGHGWVADVRVTSWFVLELAGEGVNLHELDLTEVSVHDIPASPAR